uniref:Spindle and kinetochore-associated protein 3 n=1 Tax=Castor canadensis TaxID=51338 RepID=A0A8C0WKX2_CASCN
MDPIRSFCGKLRTLASTLDGETARLQRALDGEESDFEDYPTRILHDLHSEVWTLKDNINILLDKARLENQESIGFIKATKILMNKNSTDITKIREFFEKYGYNPRVKENSVCEQRVTDSPSELAQCGYLQKPDLQGSLPGSSLSEKPPRSPQLSDFGLERYVVSRVPPQQATINRKEEHRAKTPPAKQSVIQVPKTPKCALKMDDFECVTPKLEHFGISEYTMCLNEDYTMGLKRLKNIKSEETTGTKPITNDNVFATPGPVIQSYLGLTHSHRTNNFSLILFTTIIQPYLFILDLEVKDCTSLVLSSDECFENFTDPSSPTISSYEDLLRTPTPPEVTVIPEDILQILPKYNSNLAMPIAVKAVPSRKGFLRHEGQSIRDVANKENW